MLADSQFRNSIGLWRYDNGLNDDLVGYIVEWILILIKDLLLDRIYPPSLGKLRRGKQDFLY